MIVATTLWACADEDVVVDGGSTPDVVVDAEDGAEHDAETVGAEGGQDDGGARSGPITVVTAELGLSEARVCDLDGDGLGDNSIADLGAPASSLFVAAINMSVLQGDIAGGRRNIVHIPWVEDLRSLSDPDVVFILFEGRDLDEPPNFDDDFSGHEPYYVAAFELTPCGEPRFSIRGATLDRGHLEAESPVAIPLAENIVFDSGAVIRANLEPDGGGSEFFVCFPAPIHQAGNVPGVSDGAPISMLEVLLVGGAPYGVPVPGLTPDLDLDGDGLERFVVDEDGRIERCLDGDTTTIEGRDCWRDERMADAFSLTLALTNVPAEFAGRPPNWESEVEGTCEDPPAESLWDPR